VTGAALILAALSLLLPSTPSYDPWAWLGWGRQIVHLNLHTTGGPSWKPLPVLFTTVFAPFGSAQPELWLLVARAGALLALAMVFRLAHRITAGLLPCGQPSERRRAATLSRLAPAGLAGLIAAGALLNSGGFIVQNALGYSEGLATALILIALDRLLAHAPRQALVLGFLAGLDRPELWLAWGPFALWLAWRDPGVRALAGGLLVLTPLLWFLPELWGSGHLFRGVVRAHHPRPGTAAFTGCPACTVLGQEAWPTIMRRLTFPAILALVLAARTLWRTRGSARSAGAWSPAARSWAWLLALGAGGLVWWLGIAAETQAGFAGNARYLQPGTALVAIAGGVAWGSIALLAARALRRGAQLTRVLPGLAWSTASLAGAALAAAALIALPPWIGRNVIDLPRVGHELEYQAGLRSDLGQAVAASGGARALLSCGTIMTEGYQVPMVAWVLGVGTARIEPPPPHLAGAPWPAVILQTRAHLGSALLPAPAQIAAWEHEGAHYTVRSRVRTFSVLSTCPHKVRG
jgi:hypothetical protein